MLVWEEGARRRCTAAGLCGLVAGNQGGLRVPPSISVVFVYFWSFQSPPALVPLLDVLQAVPRAVGRGFVVPSDVGFSRGVHTYVGAASLPPFGVFNL